MKKILIDSSVPVESISIIVLARNTSSYLPKMFTMLGGLEDFYDVRINYTFLENGSLDETPNLIREFLKSRDGIMGSIGNTEVLDAQPRTVKMAQLRNKAKEMSSKSSDWYAVLDTDIYFENNILEKMFAHSPSSNNIGMLCAYGIEVWPSNKTDEWVTQHHYYDTFAYVDVTKEFYWPHCAFQIAENVPQLSIIKLCPRE